MKRILLVFTSLLLALCSVSATAQTKHYEKGVEVNGAFGLDKLQKYSFGIATVHSYRFGEHFALGGGVGYEYLNGLFFESYCYKGSLYPSEHEYVYDIRSLLKLFGRAKFNLTKSSVSPFLAVDLGYTISLRNVKNMAKGFFVQPAFGCDFKIGSNQKIFIMAGYNGQQYSYDYFNLTLGESGVELQKAFAEKINVVIGFDF